RRGLGRAAPGGRPVGRQRGAAAAQEARAARRRDRDGLGRRLPVQRPTVRWPARLRWQLTLSHLAATAVTLVAMIAAVVTIGSLVFSWRGAPERQPAQDARLIARAVEGLAADPAE